MKAPFPSDELHRIKILHQFNILDTPVEQAFEDITHLASYIAQTPIATISFVDTKRQWFKSKIGLSATETPRDMAFCAHAILHPKQPMIVRDATKDSRFSDNPLVLADPKIRFYFGAPLVTHEGAALGTLCAIDQEPRDLPIEQIECLNSLSRLVITQLELRRETGLLRRVASYVRHQAIIRTISTATL